MADLGDTNSKDTHIYKAFPLDYPHGMYDYIDSHFLTARVHTMAGSFEERWEIMRRDTNLNQIVARRPKRKGE